MFWHQRKTLQNVYNRLRHLPLVSPDCLRVEMTFAMSAATHSSAIIATEQVAHLQSRKVSHIIVNKLMTSDYRNDKNTNSIVGI